MFKLSTELFGCELCFILYVFYSMTIMKSMFCGDSRTYSNLEPIYVKNILVNMKNLAISLDE